MNYLEEYKKILKGFQTLLIEENFEIILDEIYDICGDDTKDSLRKSLIRNKDDFIELVDYIFSEDFTGRAIQGWIMISGQVPNFSELSCITIVYNTKLAPLEDSDNTKKMKYSESKYTEYIFKSIITISSKSEKDSETFYDHTADILPEYYRDYYQSTYLKHVFYYEGEGGFRLLEETIKNISEEYNCVVENTTQEKVTLSEWDDIKKKLELFEYNTRDLE